MRAPLDQFADRIVRNGEVEEFVCGLMEKGAKSEDIEAAIDKILLRQGIHTCRSPKMTNAELDLVASLQYRGLR